MDNESLVVTQKIYTGTSIVKNTTAWTDVTNLEYTRGYISMLIDMTGSGTASITPFISLDAVGTSDADATWTQPYDSTGTAIVIATGLTASTGPGTDGQHVYPVEIPPAMMVKFLITETANVSPITPIIRVAVQ